MCTMCDANHAIGPGEGSTMTNQDSLQQEVPLSTLRKSVASILGVSLRHPDPKRNQDADYQGERAEVTRKMRSIKNLRKC